jgi:hypothetical protein
MNTLWAIRRKRDSKLLGVRISGNQSAEFCGSYEAFFDDHSDIPHFFSSKATAERAIASDTPWYNSGLESPQWDETFTKTNEVEIVEVSLIINGS